MSIFQFHSSRFKAPPRNVLRYQRGVFLIQRIRLQKEWRIDHYSNRPGHHKSAEGPLRRRVAHYGAPQAIQARQARQASQASPLDPGSAVAAAARRAAPVSAPTSPSSSAASGPARSAARRRPRLVGGGRHLDTRT